MKSFTFNNLTIERYVVGALEENTYLIYEKDCKEAILVDPGADSEEIVDSINELGINNLTVFITHGHADHIAGLEYFRKHFPFAKVAVSVEDSAMLTDSHKNLSDFMGIPIVCKKAEMLLKEGDKITIGNHTGNIAHIPGHTPGGLALIFDEFIISGDSLFCESVGRSDFPDGDGRALVKNIKSKLLSLTDRPIFSGHGSETSVEHEKTHNPFLNENAFWGF